MLTKRIIPCLDIKNGRTVKGIQFEHLRDAGDPIELAKRYVEEGADELVFLDITATIDKRKTLIELVERLSDQLNIPFTIGGGISSKEQVSELLKAGADKVSINSAAVKNPNLINELSLAFGSQCIVVGVDVKWNGSQWKLFINSGTIETEWTALDWAKEVEKRGAGEILLTSMNADGGKNGFSVDITKTIGKALTIPVIASGGAGSMKDFVDVFSEGNADAALAASIFHFGEIAIPELKAYLSEHSIPMRCTTLNKYASV